MKPFVVMFAGFLLACLSLAALTDIENAKADASTKKDVEINVLVGKVDALQKQLNELRWDVDDLRIKTRDGAELEQAQKIGKEQPESVVVVSEDYPKWRLPYGVKVNDKRPPEIIAKDIESAKNGKGVAYMWMSVPQDDGRELRVYMTEVTWKDPKKAADPAAE